MAKKTKEQPLSVAKPGVPSDSAKAYIEVQPLLAAIAPADVLRINLDIPRAVSIAVGAVPHLAKLRDAAAKLPGFDIANIDRLGTYALAAWYAHLLALPVSNESTVNALLEEAKPLREDMLDAAELLAKKKFFDKEVVKAIRAGTGNIDTANDLVALAALYTAGWSRVEHKSPVEWAEVERASLLGPEILVALGERDQPGVQLAAGSTPTEQRARAFTLFFNAYDQARRAATYLRWNEEDAEMFAPSLFPGRGRRTSSEEASPAAAPAPLPASPAAPAPVK
ncbi:MAG: hypothetical protein U0441_20565 [Polyangiaceae bacterium]